MAARSGGRSAAKICTSTSDGVCLDLTPSDISVSSVCLSVFPPPFHYNHKLQ